MLLQYFFKLRFFSTTLDGYIEYIYDCYEYDMNGALMSVASEVRRYNRTHPEVIFESLKVSDVKAAPKPFEDDEHTTSGLLEVTKNES